MPPKKRIHDMLMAFQNRFPPTALMAKEIASDRVSKSTKSLAEKKTAGYFPCQIVVVSYGSFIMVCYNPHIVWVVCHPLYNTINPKQLRFFSLLQMLSIHHSIFFANLSLNHLFDVHAEHERRLSCGGST